MNRVIILLVVGLMAFSSAMKELNQLQQFSLDASRLAAQWSAKIAPAEVPQTTEIPQMVARVESCEIQQSLPSVELPWLAHTGEKKAPKPSAVVPRPSQVIELKKKVPQPEMIQIARLKNLPLINIDPVQFEVKIPLDHDDDRDAVFSSESSPATFRARTRKFREIKFNTHDREMILKTLNRSINLRSAS